MRRIKTELRSNLITKIIQKIDEDTRNLVWNSTYLYSNLTQFDSPIYRAFKVYLDEKI